MRSDRHAVDLSDAVILVVDDVAANRQVLSAILRKAGYQVLSAGNAAQALQRVEVQVPDLILLDIMMPGDDGYSLCAKLQEHPRTQDVPIIFLSALRDIGDKLKAFVAGSRPSPEVQAAAEQAGVDLIENPPSAALNVSSLNCSVFAVPPTP